MLPRTMDNQCNEELDQTITYKMFWPNVTDKAAPVAAKIFQDIWNMIWQLSIYLGTLLSLFVNTTNKHNFLFI